MVSTLIGACKIIDGDRRILSRERNKMHARKTRQRKKEHMTQLESTVDALKEEQIGLKLRIKEKNTANILVDMLSSSSTRSSKINSRSNDQLVDPKLDALLKRKEEDIPDASKIPDLPALILPGNHNKRRKLDTSLSKAASKLAQAPVTINVQQEYPNDGIDYELLGKDRTSCTPEELDKIRKERNRMHAKRTRDRKRIFMEEMEKIIKQLETENELLQNHLSEISTDSATAASLSSSGRVTPSDTKQLSHDIQTNTAAETQNNMESRNLISCGSSTVSASPSPSLNLPNSNPNPPTLQLSRSQQQVPLSITTTSNAGGDMHC